MRKKYNMRNKYLFLTILSIGLLSVSCVREPENILPDPNLNLDFTFQTRSEKAITVSAVNEKGQPASGTLFSIYAENPYSEEDGNRNGIAPIYRGFTESDGKVIVKLASPNNAKELYIVPDYAGYGQMQTISTENTNISVELKGAQFASTKALTKAASEATIADRDGINCGNNFRFYTYYRENEDYDPDYGVLNTSSELVSEDVLDNPFKEYVSEVFPEAGGSYADLKCTDIVVGEDQTEVWLTFIGDGGYTDKIAYLNSIFYYTYEDESDLPNIQNDAERKAFFASPTFHHTYAFININPTYTPSGTKVQLLYWNGEKYVQYFPKDVKIGFAFVLDGYRPTTTTRGFSLNSKNIVYSTPKLNISNDSRSLLFESKDFGCWIMGMEYGGKDGDYNDALLKVTASKTISTVNVETPIAESSEIASTQQGTLAFEDLWPYEGDYDFNDFVTDYKYEFYKIKRTNNISYLKMTFTPKAMGASEENGFGIELPLSVASVAVEGASLESGNEKATIIVYANNRADAFNGATGKINTTTYAGHIDGTPVTITVRFASPVAEDNINPSLLNPFLFRCNNRGREVHLVDYTPTSKADKSFFGTADDKSYPANGTYYRMDNEFPWALDIAGTGSFIWKYPYEMVKITEAYLHYGDWVDNPDSDWYDWTIDGNADESKLYK